MTTRKDHLDGLAIGLLIVCCLFWGFQQTLIKTTVAEVPPLWQASLRFAGATLLLMLWCRLRNIPLWARDGTLPAGLLAGLLFTGEFACIYLGIHATTASRITVFLYTSPFVVALLLPRWVPAEKLSPPQWLGLLMAFAGVALAFSEGFAPSAGQHWHGDLLGLLAGLFWGLTTLVLRTSKLASAAPEKTLLYQIAVTAVLAPFISLALGETWSLQYSGWAWGSLALQTVVGAFASYLTWMWMLRHYPATQMSSFTFLTPVFALLLGALLLHEQLTPQLVLALLGVAVGIVLVNRKRAA